MVCTGNLQRPANGSDLLGPDGREDREKALLEVKYLRSLINDLSQSQRVRRGKENVRGRAPMFVPPSTMAQAQAMLKNLRPERKLDFKMLGKLPVATRVTDLKVWLIEMLPKQ